MSSTEHFRIVAYAQLTWRESSRDIEATLIAHGIKLYGMGLRHSVRRSTLTDANKRRDCLIWADFAVVLIRRTTKAAFRLNMLLDLRSSICASRSFWALARTR